MNDDSMSHGPTIAGFWEHHMCLPACLQAAEMNRDREANVCHPGHDPGVTRDAQPTTHVPGMQHDVEDPYRYSPQFLPLPHAFFASGLDYATLRAPWFAARALLFIAMASALVRNVGDKAIYRSWRDCRWSGSRRSRCSTSSTGKRTSPCCSCCNPVSSRWCPPAENTAC